MECTECAKCGGVVRCMIPVPRPLAGQPALPQDEHVGKIFVEFKDLGGSARAKDLLHGRKFDGKSVIARKFDGKFDITRSNRASFGWIARQLGG
ncbi:hypothetical protein T484DRAFT_1860227 [Baffinella frigidus]|nr:hypothetical protein T484DRAFT_1860227 [Cryptophyta sp. CCMP2293]